jgi:hypothetical protein
MECRCGELLLLDNDERYVRAVSGEQIPFSRGTDHIVCPVCMRSYRVKDLRAAKPSWAAVEALAEILEVQHVTDELLRELRGDTNRA